MRQTVLRELKEETGLTAELEAVNFLGLIHSFGTDREPRLLSVFRVDTYAGTPTIGEPEKCSELAWFDLAALPDNIIPSRRLALDRLDTPGFYFEYGWERLNML